MGGRPRQLGLSDARLCLSRRAYLAFARSNAVHEHYPSWTDLHRQLASDLRDVGVVSATAAILARRTLSKNTLERTAVHVQATCCL